MRFPGKIPAKPGNIMMGIAAVLFCLVLFSTHLMGGLYARYTASGQGCDSARVVRFGPLTLTEDGDFDGTPARKGMIIPGVPLKKDARVSFSGSETATVVFVEVTLEGSGDSRWERDNDTFTLSGQAQPMLQWAVAAGWTLLPDSGYVYYRELAPNETLENAAFIADNGTITVSEDITEAVIGSLGDTRIDLQASVVQTDGSMTVKALWESLKGGAA